MVYPSAHEVFGLVPLEALLWGTPVIVSGDSGCGEVIGRTGGGQVVPSATPLLSRTRLHVRCRPRMVAGRRRPRRGNRAVHLCRRVVCEQIEEMYPTS